MIAFKDLFNFQGQFSIAVMVKQNVSKFIKWLAHTWWWIFHWMSNYSNQKFSFCSDVLYFLFIIYRSITKWDPAADKHSLDNSNYLNFQGGNLFNFLRLCLVLLSTTINKPFISWNKKSHLNIQVQRKKKQVDFVFYTI